MGYVIHYQCLNHIGCCRSMNQDNFICMGDHLNEQQTGIAFPLQGCVKPGKEAVFGVFDGMGGEECGEVASFLAAQCAENLRAGDSPEEDLIRFCLNANDRICEYAAGHGVHVMGTTAAILAFTKPRIVLCNIGDSRVYRYAKNQLQQISVDHVAEGAFGRKAPLSQNLGILPEEMQIQPFAASGGYYAGDLYLICSDGLTDMVPPEEICRILGETPFEETGSALLRTALNNGGRDNITLILCKVEKEKRGLFRFLKGE